MASYRYESSGIYDVVLWEDKKLIVGYAAFYNKPCDHCFFNKEGNICSGIACLPHEREDGKNVIYQEYKF